MTTPAEPTRRYTFALTAAVAATTLAVGVTAATLLGWFRPAEPTAPPAAVATEPAAPPAPVVEAAASAVEPDPEPVVVVERRHHEHHEEHEDDDD